jgi:cyclic beta-1,2-glucan synthetase
MRSSTARRSDLRRRRDSGAVMTPFAALSNRKSDIQFEARHGLGYSVFSSVQNESGDRTRPRRCDRERPVKLQRMRLRNNGSGVRKLRLYGYVEWVLGNNPQKTAPFIISEHDAEWRPVLPATTTASTIPAASPSSLPAKRSSGYTASRREFFGKGAASCPGSCERWWRVVEQRRSLMAIPAAAIC